MQITENRKKTNEVFIRGIGIGSSNRITVQSMTNTKTADVAATIAQIKKLEEVGCDIVRLAIPDMAAASAIAQIRKLTEMPLVADIHFDHRLAIACIENGIDKVRINPGNIGDREGVRKVAIAAREWGIPIRIGVNSGSLDKNIFQKYNGVTADGLVESAMLQADMLRQFDFEDIVISIKATDIFLTVEACTLLSQKTMYPQHIGMTESGTPITGTVKSAIGISRLLQDGVGDTVRVSLTGDPVTEVIAAKEILSTLGISKGGIELISCPTCGRCNIDIIQTAQEIEQHIRKIKTTKRFKVAVMGCAVNGPGEAREADVGIAGGIGKALFFRKGEPQYSVPEDKVVSTLLQEIENLIQNEE